MSIERLKFIRNSLISTRTSAVRVRPIDHITGVDESTYKGYQDIFYKGTNVVEKEANPTFEEVMRVSLQQQLGNDRQSYKILGSQISPDGTPVTYFMDEAGRIVTNKEISERENSSKCASK
jgi:hypothetical protein